MIDEFDEDQILTLKLITWILSGISMLTLIFVIITFIIFKKIRSIALELIIWLCISNLFFYIGYFLPIEDDLACSISSILYMAMDTSSVMWVTIIVYTAYMSLVKQNYLEKNRNYYRMVFFLMANVVPIIMALMYIIII
jgi:hypothetical protein